MSDDDPEFDASDFETINHLIQMGQWGLTIYRSIIRDGGDAHEAFSVTAAFFAGMMKGSFQGEQDASGTS